jgi:hypothetical protein
MRGYPLRVDFSTRQTVAHSCNLVRLGFVCKTRISIMPTHMPPVPPANRSKDDHGSDSVKKVSNDKLVKHEHHANAAEKGETANIKQSTTNKGFFRGRPFG